MKSESNNLTKVANIRADGQGMRLIMLAPEESDYDSTKDVKGDSDIFIIDAVRDGGGFLGRTDEGFDLIGGSVYSDSSFNVNYSPGRNLIRWGRQHKSWINSRVKFIFKMAKFR